MANFIKKFIAIALVINAGTSLLARGGGRHGGGGGRGHAGGHHGAQGHHAGGHHAGQAGHHAGHGYAHHGAHQYGHGWQNGRAGIWGGRGFYAYPGWWIWGATAAIVAGSFYFAGRSASYWQQTDPVYYQQYVLPAYQRYQANPSSIPERSVSQEAQQESEE